MKDRKKMIEDTDEDIEKLFKKDVTIDLIKDSLKDIGLLRMNAIRSLIYNNLFPLLTIQIYRIHNLYIY